MKLRDAVRALQVPDRDELVTALLKSGEFSVQPSISRGLLNRGILDRDNFYAVHNSDLDLLSSCAVLACALPAVFTTPIPVLAALLLVLYRYRRKRAKLSVTQGLILCSLKQAAPNGLAASTIVKTVDELLTVPTRRALKLNTVKVKAELANLKNVRLENGTATSFVFEKNRRWFAVDV